MTDTPTSAPSNVPAPRVIAARYEVIRTLGRGGMGEVLLAHDRVLDRQVALKQLRPELAANASFVERLAREARTLARVRHPGVIHVHDFLPGVDGAAYLVLEFVPEESLANELASQPQLPWGRCAALGAAVCDALDAALAVGVIHRDIKPSNILLERDGTVRVADFGVARLTDASATHTGAVLGTPVYMAPEVGRGKRAEPRSDVYGLAAVLFETACGRPPFVSEDGDSSAVLVMHIVEPVPDPWEFAPELPSKARDILIKGLEKEPGDRFGSAAEMAAALRASADAHPRILPARAEAEPSATAADDEIESSTAPPETPSASGAVTAPPLEAPETVPPTPVPQAAPETRFRAPAPVPPTRASAVPSKPLADEPAKGVSRRWIGAAALLGALAIGGGAELVTRAGAPPPVSVPLKHVNAGTASVGLPGDWTAADSSRPETAGLGLRSTPAADPGTGPTFLAPTSGDAPEGLTIGWSDAKGSAMLLPRFLDRVSGKLPKPAAVKIGQRAEGHYLGEVSLTKPAGSRVALVLVPTSTGVLTVACFGPEATFATHRARCESLLATLKPGKVTVFPIGPDAGYARFLGHRLSAFSEARKAGLTEMRSGGTRAVQADDASRAAEAYAALRSALEKRVVSPEIADLQGNLAAAAAAGASRYSSLASAARDGSTSGWRTAHKSAHAADAALSAAVNPFGPAGYPGKGKR